MQEKSATAHAIASLATCMLISQKGWKTADSFMLWQARFHGEKGLEIEENALAHVALGMWHRGCCELSSVSKFLMNFNSGYKPNYSIQKSIYHFQTAVELVPENNIFKAELALSFIAANMKEQAVRAIQDFIHSPILNFPAALEMTNFYKKKLSVREL